MHPEEIWFLLIKEVTLMTSMTYITRNKKERGAESVSALFLWLMSGYIPNGINTVRYIESLLYPHSELSPKENTTSVCFLAKK